MKKFDIMINETTGRPDLYVDGMLSDPNGPLHASYLIDYLSRHLFKIASDIHSLNQLENVISEDIEKLRTDAEFARTYLEKAND